MKKNIKQSKTEKVPFFTSFYRSQASSVLSTVVDFCVFGLLHYIIHAHYALSSGLGNLTGAVVSFYLGRVWAFQRKDGKITHQAFRYAVTSFTSALINTSAVVLLTESFALEPFWSKVIASIIVGATFNFLMFRYFVYK